MMGSLLQCMSQVVAIATLAAVAQGRRYWSEAAGIAIDL
jgi:hypothetical protein